MRKSFVLRDGLGNVVGYLQQVGHYLRCGIRATLGETDCELLVLNTDRLLDTKALSTPETEFEWYREDGEIAGGCIVKDGRILADTGNDVRDCVLRTRHCAKTEPCKEERNNTSIACVRAPEDSKPYFLHWPHNPCCPNAYR